MFSFATPHPEDATVRLVGTVRLGGRRWWVFFSRGSGTFGGVWLRGGRSQGWNGIGFAYIGSRVMFS